MKIEKFNSGMHYVMLTNDLTTSFFKKIKRHWNETASDPKIIILEQF
jgi:hypothetical protein